MNEAVDSVAALVQLLPAVNFDGVQDCERGGVPCWEVTVDGQGSRVMVTAVPD